MHITFRHLAVCLLAAAIVLVACSPQAAATPAPTSPPPTALPPTSVPTATVVPPSPTLPPTDTPYPVFWDDFSSEFLPGWSWIRENDALWSLTSEPGYLRIVLDSSRPVRNILVREVGSEDFQIMTHVLFEPTTNYQFAGLTVYQDDDTLASFGRAYCNNPGTCVGNGIYFDAFDRGQYRGNNFAVDTAVKDEAYLRMDKAGSLLSGYYSEDGVNWTLIGEHDVYMLDPKVGLLAGNSHVVGMTALYDYFTVMEMP